MNEVKETKELEFEDQIEHWISNNYYKFEMVMDLFFRYMRDNGFTWGFNKISPTRNEVEEEFKIHMNRAIQHGCCASGRIMIEYDKEDKEDKEFKFFIEL